MSLLVDLSSNGKLQKGQVQKGHKACGIQCFLVFHFIKNIICAKGYYDNKVQCIKFSTIAC